MALAFAGVLYFSFALSSAYQKRTFYTYVKFALVFAVITAYMAVIVFLLDFSWVLLFVYCGLNVTHFPAFFKFYSPLLLFFLLLFLSALLMRKLFNVPAKPLYHLTACVFIISLLVPTIEYAKVEYLTYKYKESFKKGYVPIDSGGLEKSDVYKVFHVAGGHATIFKVTCEPSFPGDIDHSCYGYYLIYKRKNGKWVCLTSCALWGGNGNPDVIPWPPY